MNESSERHAREMFVSFIGLCFLAAAAGFVQAPREVILMACCFFLGAWLEYKRATR